MAGQAAGMSEEQADAAMTNATTIYDGGKEVLAGAATLVAAYGYNKYTQGVIASKVAPSGQKVFSTKEGGFATKSEGGKFYASDENGNGLLDKKGNPIELDKADLDGGIKSSGKRLNDLGGRLSPFKKGSEESSEKSNNARQNNQGEKQDSAPKQSSEHSTPPNKDMTGSNPSHTNNSTTKNSTKQEALNSAKENLSKISNTSNSDFAKGEIAMIAGQKESELKQRHESGQITDADYRKQMSGINNLKSKLSSGADIGIADTQKAGITAKELSEAGDQGTRSAGEP